MKALILAGGAGTRLRPITHTRAKQLVPVANTPILFYGIEAMAEAGIKEIGVIVGDTGDEVREALGDGSRFGVSFTFLPQEAPLGLAHCVLIARDFLGADDFVMYLGDNLLEQDLAAFVDAFERGPRRRPTRRRRRSCSSRSPTRTASASPPWTTSGHVVELVEKPDDPPSDLALVGVYLFDATIHEAVRAIEPSARGELEITDAIQWLIDHGHRVRTELLTGWWIDTGKLTPLLEANRLLLEKLEHRIDGTVDEPSLSTGASSSRPAPRSSTPRSEDRWRSGAAPASSTASSARSRPSAPGAAIVNSEIEHSVVMDDSRGRRHPAARGLADRARGGRRAVAAPATGAAADGRRPLPDRRRVGPCRAGCSSPARPGSSVPTTCATCWPTSDDAVTIYDALTYAGNRDNVADLVDDRRCRFVHADICDQDDVVGHLAGHDAVVHFAAESHVDRSIKDPYAFVRTNCHGTNVLCDVAREVGVERFLHISTDEVYGTIAEGSFSETDVLTPRSPYSAAKAGSRSHRPRRTGRRTGCRSSSPARATSSGRTSSRRRSSRCSSRTCSTGTKVPLYGDGMNVRDWLFVDDNVRAIDLVLRSGADGEIYNIGADNELPNIELTRKLLALCGRDESWIEPVEDRLGHDRRYSITTDKIEALGWRTQHDLDDGARRHGRSGTATNREWWEPLKAHARCSDGAAARHRGRRSARARRRRARDGRRRRRDRPDRHARRHRPRRRARRPDLAAPRCRRQRAAWTAVDACETTPSARSPPTPLAVRWVAEGCHRVGAHLVHVSTDYVFDGTLDRPVPRVGSARATVGVRRVEAGR